MPEYSIQGGDGRLGEDVVTWLGNGGGWEEGEDGVGGGVGKHVLFLSVLASERILTAAEKVILPSSVLVTVTVLPHCPVTTRISLMLSW